MSPATEATAIAADAAATDAAASGAKAPENSAATTRFAGGVSSATDILGGPSPAVSAPGMGASSFGPQFAAEEELETAQAAVAARVQEAVERLQAEQRAGVQWIAG